MIDRKIVNAIIAWSAKILFSALFVLFFISYMYMEGTKKPQEEIDAILGKQRQSVAAVLSGKKIDEKGKIIPDNWPPNMNQPYPDLELVDRNGRIFKLSDLKGYVIVLSYVDMSSPVSQAQAGAVVTGPYGIIKDVDKQSEPFSEKVHKNASDGFNLPNDGVLEVNILIYTQDGAQATPNDAAKWADHFDLELSKGVVVAVPKNDLRGKETQEILTGYHLIDQHMMLRVDSSGIEPKHNLEMTLVPLLSKLAK